LRFGFGGEKLFNIFVAELKSDPPKS